jgi:hypothetical protein
MITFVVECGESEFYTQSYGASKKKTGVDVATLLKRLSDGVSPIPSQSGFPVTKAIDTEKEEKRISLPLQTVGVAGKGTSGVVTHLTQNAIPIALALVTVAGLVSIGIGTGVIPLDRMSRRKTTKR